MNMKLLAGLAVAITLASAITYVGLTTEKSSVSPAPAISASASSGTSKTVDAATPLPPNSGVGTKLEIVQDNVDMKVNVK